MKNLIFFLSIFIVTPFSSMGQAGEGFKLIHVEDLSQLINSPSKRNVYIYDANNEATRKSYGLIPGAKALTVVTNYDLSILPQNKNAKLVFYCANPECMSSHEAAKRAASNGYTDVSVMSDGIQGWKKAGKQTKKM